MRGLVTLCLHRALPGSLQIMYSDRNFAAISLFIFNHLRYLCLQWSFLCLDECLYFTGQSERKCTAKLRTDSYMYLAIEILKRQNHSVGGPHHYFCKWVGHNHALLIIQLVEVPDTLTYSTVFVSLLFSKSICSLSPGIYLVVSFVLWLMVSGKCIFSLQATKGNWAKAVWGYPTMARYYFLSACVVILEAVRVL